MEMEFEAHVPVVFLVVSKRYCDWLIDAPKGDVDLNRF